MFAQNVGIGTNNPDNKAKLEIDADDAGLLIPRVTTTERNAISAAAGTTPNGLLVYDTDLDQFFYWDESLASGAGCLGTSYPMASTNT